MKRYAQIFILVLVLFLFGYTGCARQADEEEMERIRVTVVLPERNDSYWSEIERGILQESGASTSGKRVSFKFVSPEIKYNVSQMSRLIKQEIAAKVDVLVVQGNIDEEYGTTFTQALEAGIKVICIDTDMTEVSGCIYIGSDNYAAGRLIGEEAARMCGGQAGISVVLGQVSHNQDLRLAGLQDILTEYPDMEIKRIQYDNTDGVTFMDIYFDSGDEDMLINLEGTGSKVLGSVNPTVSKPYRYVLGFDQKDGIRNGVVDGIIEQDMSGIGQQVVKCIEEYAGTGRFSDEDYFTAVTWVSKYDVEKERQE